MNREKQEDSIYSSSSLGRSGSRVRNNSDTRNFEPAGVNGRREKNNSSGRDNRSSRDDRRRREDTRTERRKGNKDLNMERKYAGRSDGRNERRTERDRDREDDTRKKWSETGGARRESTLRDGQGEVRILYTGSRGAPFSGQKNIFDQRSSQQQTVSVENEQSSSGKRRLSIENDRLTRYEGEKQDDYRKGVQNKGRVFESEGFLKINPSNSFKLQPGEHKRKSQTPENTNWQDTINSVFNQSNSTGFGVSQPASVIPSLSSEKQEQSLFKSCETSKLTDKPKRPVLLANPDPAPNLTGFSKPLQISSVQGTSKLSMLDNNQGKKIKLDPSWTRPGVSFSDTTPSSSTPALMSNVLRKGLDLEPTGIQKSDERVEVLKTQIGELKSYILKLEKEKQKAEENSSSSASTCTCAKDAQLLALIKENIEKVRIGQEKEKEKLEHDKGRLEVEKSSLISEQERLHEEKERLEKARVNLKQTLEQGMKLLEGEKGKMEREIKMRLEHEGKKELDGLRMKLAEVEEERNKEKGSKNEEEKRHVEEELKELEIRKEMTTKAIESEARIEELETIVGHSDSQITELKTELGTYKTDVLKLMHQVEEERREKETLKKEYDGDYRAFLDKKSGLEEGVRIRCVFCPGENMVSLVGFIFHVAREHMFDQYKKVELETEAQQVGLLLRRLEDKVKSSTSSQEVNSLHSRIHQLESQVERFEATQKQKIEEKVLLEKKIVGLEQDLESLLSVKSTQQEEMETLITKNNTLMNQVNNTIQQDNLRTENKDLRVQHEKLSRSVLESKEKIVALERERNVLRQRWNTEAGEKMGIKTKLKELIQEKEHLQKRLKEREAGFLETRNALGKELKEVREEGNSWRRKMEGMEGKVTAWKLEKSSLESQLSSLKTELCAIKEFRTDLNSVNEILLQEIRTENKNLSSTVKSLSKDKFSLKSKISNLQLKQEELKQKLQELQDKIQEQQEKIHKQQEKMEKQQKKIQEQKFELKTSSEEKIELNTRIKQQEADLEKNKNRLENVLAENMELEGDLKTGFKFSNFDLGLESLLRTPLDDLSLQIDNIDILNNRAFDKPEQNQLEPEEEHEQDEIETQEDYVEQQENIQEREGQDLQDREAKELRSNQDYSNTVIRKSSTDSSDDDFVVELDDTVDVCDELPTDPLNESTEHGMDCDCADCDDVDYLHGFVDGKPYGIKEMMEDLNTDEPNQSEHKEFKNFAIDTSDELEYNDDVEDLLGDD